MNDEKTWDRPDDLPASVQSPEDLHELVSDFIFDCAVCGSKAVVEVDDQGFIDISCSSNGCPCAHGGLMRPPEMWKDAIQCWAGAYSFIAGMAFNEHRKAYTGVLLCRSCGEPVEYLSEGLAAFAVLPGRSGYPVDIIHASCAGALCEKNGGDGSPLVYIGLRDYLYSVLQESPVDISRLPLLRNLRKIKGA